MKITALVLILFLVSSALGVGRRATTSKASQPIHVKSVNFQTLEDRFKQIDEESDTVKVKVTGDGESSGNIIISTKRAVNTSKTATESAGESIPQSSSKWKEETLLNIDLSELTVTDKYIDEKIAAAFAIQGNVGTLPGVKVRQIGASGNYEVVEDYIYNSGAYSITVLNGFTYDRASIPRIFWVLIDKDSLSNVAPLFHDLLYRNGGVLPNNQVSPYRKFSREDTDKLFLELMTKCGVKQWRREAAYQAVRRFAGPAWKEHP